MEPTSPTSSLPATALALLLLAKGLFTQSSQAIVDELDASADASRHGFSAAGHGRNLSLFRHRRRFMA